MEVFFSSSIFERLIIRLLDFQRVKAPPKITSEGKLFLQVARKLAMVEADLERAEERAEAGEA